MNEIEVEIKICDNELDAISPQVMFTKPGVYMHTFDMSTYPAVSEAYPSE